MKHKCFKDSCREIPDIFCKCQNDPEAMCSKHIRNHYLKHQDKIHIIISAFKNLTSDLKDPVIEYFKCLIKKNNEMKKSIIDET